jgi:hypothetical protein
MGQTQLGGMPSIRNFRPKLMPSIPLHVESIPVSGQLTYLPNDGYWKDALRRGVVLKYVPDLYQQYTRYSRLAIFPINCQSDS